MNSEYEYDPIIVPDWGCIYIRQKKRKDDLIKTVA